MVVARPKFFIRITAAQTTPEALTRKLAQEATLISPANLPPLKELRDPKDLPVLACAVAAQAGLVISGDKDLLTLRSFQSIPIVNAREALLHFP